MDKGHRELATKDNLGGKSDEALTVTKTNELEKYYRRAIINNTYMYTTHVIIGIILLTTLVSFQPKVIF